MTHLSAISRFPVDDGAQLLIRQTLASANVAHHIEQFLRLQMVADDGAIFAQIHHIKRMQQVLPVDIDILVPILQDEDNTRLGMLRTCHHRIHAERRVLYIRILLDVCQQVEAEFIQPQIHDVDAGIHILYVYHFFLKLLELVLAVFQVTLLVLRQQVVIARTGEDGGLHTALYTTFQFDILVQFHIRPVVNQLNNIVSAADTIYTAETLDDADRIPMDIIVDQEITILQVLTLGNAVGGNQHINLLGGIREESSPVFR